MWSWVIAAPFLTTTVVMPMPDTELKLVLQRPSQHNANPLRLARWLIPCLDLCLCDAIETTNLTRPNACHYWAPSRISPSALCRHWFHSFNLGPQPKEELIATYSIMGCRWHQRYRHHRASRNWSRLTPMSGGMSKGIADIGWEETSWLGEGITEHVS
jgi:hypothetical protein